MSYYSLSSDGRESTQVHIITKLQYEDRGLRPDRLASGRAVNTCICTLEARVHLPFRES